MRHLEIKFNQNFIVPGTLYCFLALTVYFYCRYNKKSGYRFR